VSNRRRNRTLVFILFVVVVVVFLTNIPLMYGYLNQPPHLKFMGIVAGVHDTNFYFMLMIQADGWSPVLHNYFMGSGTGAIYHGLFWFLLGKAAHVLPISDVAAFQGARIAATLLFVPVAYWFASRFLESSAERCTALVLITLGAGAGWAPMLLYRTTGTLSLFPADVATPEATPFFTMMTFPHLALALVLVALCFGLVETSLSTQKLWPAAVGGICGAFLGFVHAVNLVVLCAVLGAFLVAAVLFLRDSRPVKPIVVFGILSVWPIVYYLYLVLTKMALLPHIAERSPSPLSYIVGFAPLAILSLIYVIHVITERAWSIHDVFLVCWVAVNSLLLYSYPLLLQEARAVLGLHLPLAILSTRGVFRVILPWLYGNTSDAADGRKKIGEFVIPALVIALTLPSTFYNIFERVSRLRDYPESFSLMHAEYEALGFLHDLPDGSVVLSGEWIGNYVPRLTRKRAWLGLHGVDSHETQLNQAKAFFSARTSAAERYDFLKRNEIGYVYYGMDERKLGNFDPETAEFLEPVFQNSTVRIYRFRGEEEPYARSETI